MKLMEKVNTKSRMNVFINHSVNDINDINDKNVFLNHFANDFVNTKVNMKSRINVLINHSVNDINDNKSVVLSGVYLRPFCSTLLYKITSFSILFEFLRERRKTRQPLSVFFFFPKNWLLLLFQFKGTSRFPK